MKKNEQDIFSSYKSEAAEHLFADLHFDERMKEKVRNEVRAEKRSKLSKRHWSWIAASAAAVICLIVLLPEWQSSLTQEPPTVIEGPNTLIGTPDIPDQTAVHELTFHTINEAKLWFGEELSEVPYVTEPFQLERIHGLTDGLGQPVHASFIYVHREQSYSVIQQKQFLPLMRHEDEKVVIHDVDGYFTPADFTELHWIDGEIQFLIVGDISKEEALKVARAIQQK